MKMNAGKIKYLPRLIWRDVWNITGDYFSGIREENSKWYQGFSQLPPELRIYRSIE